MRFSYIKQSTNFTKQRILNRFRTVVTDFNIAGDMEIATASNIRLSEKFRCFRINFELEKAK
jgi:ribosomal protein S13